MQAPTQFEKTLTVSAEHIKSILQDYQNVIQTDKQQEFEI